MKGENRFNEPDKQNNDAKSIATSQSTPSEESGTNVQEGGRLGSTESQATKGVPSSSPVRQATGVRPRLKTRFREFRGTMSIATCGA